MMESWTGRKLAIGGLLMIGLAGPGWVLGPASIPSLRWRLELVGSKLTGKAPHLSWPLVLRATLPNRLAGAWRQRSGWAVSRRVESRGPCPVLWDTPLGALWGRNFDDPVLENLLQEQIALRLYEHATAQVKPGDVVLDLGSHLGTFTHYALARGARLVVAFEPEPDNNACFQRTFGQALRQGRVILVEAAVWNTPGELRFRRDVESSADSSSRGAAGAVSAGGDLSVRAVTIDGTVSALALDRVDFIKMDIEGAERYAVEGAAETLKRFRPRMAVCIYHRGDDPQVVPAMALKARPDYRVHLSRQVAYFY